MLIKGINAVPEKKCISLHNNIKLFKLFSTLII